MYYQNLTGTTVKSFRIGKNGYYVESGNGSLTIKNPDGTIGKIEVENVIINNKNLLDSEFRVAHSILADKATNATSATSAEHATNADSATSADNGVTTEQVNSWNAKADKGWQALFTLEPANWTGVSKSWSYTLSITGVTALTEIKISPQVNATTAEIEAYQNANLQDGGQSTNSIILKAVCEEKPTSQIKIRIIVGPELKS